MAASAGGGARARPRVPAAGSVTR